MNGFCVYLEGILEVEPASDLILKPNYKDIIESAGVDPKWYDENGVPRFCEFHPWRAVRPDAHEAFLIEVGCQDCGRLFKVAMTWLKSDAEDGVSEFSGLPLSSGKAFQYGALPNVGCCQIGPTMSSDFVGVLEGWRRASMQPWEKLDAKAMSAIKKAGRRG